MKISYYVNEIVTDEFAALFLNGERIIPEQIVMVNSLFEEFENKAKYYDTISHEIDNIKEIVDQLALKKI